MVNDAYVIYVPIFFRKAYFVGTHLNYLKFINTYFVDIHVNCIDKSMQFKWIPTTYATTKK